MFRLKACLAILLIACLILPACQVQQEEDSLISEELIVPEKITYDTFEVAKSSMFTLANGLVAVEFTDTRKISWDIPNCVITAIHVAGTTQVKQGQALISFQGKDNKTAVEAKKLELTQYEMEVAEKKTSMLTAIDEARMEAQNLTSYERIIADCKIEKLQIDYDKYLYTTNAELAKRRQDLADMEMSAEEQVLTAPCDGEIKQLGNLSVGDSVGTGQELYELASYEKFILLPRDDSNVLRYNMEVVLDIKNGTYTGTVITAGNILPPKAEGSSKKLDSVVRVKLDEFLEPANVKTGRIRYTAYPQRLQNVLQVKNEYINYEETKKYVNILDGDVIRKRYVTVGMTNRNAYWILDGLSEGQILVNG